MLRLVVLALALGLALFGFTGLAVAQVTVGEFVEEVYETPHPYPSSGADSPELTWSEEILHPGATYVAVHFSRFQLAEGDHVVVRSPDGKQSWTYRGLGRRGLGMSGDGFFATHIKGDHALIELFTTGHDSGHGFTIDRYGRGYNEQEIEDFWSLGLGEKMNLPIPGSWQSESVCTADDTEEIRCYETSQPAVWERSRAVARLLLNGSVHCTGWLVGCEGHVMTNEHCIGSQSQANNIDFEFVAEGATCGTNCAFAGGCPGIIEASGGTLVAFDAPLDYALVLADTSVANNTDLVATYGFLQLRDTGAVLDEQIYVVQHPAGWGKRVAWESTYPDDVTLGGMNYATGLGEVPCSGGPGDVGYWADTQGGSSGSPVLAVSDHRVVALHHCRGSASCTTGNPGTDDRNRGVPIEAVIADLGPDLPQCATCDPPAAPVNPQATATGIDTIELSWMGISGPGVPGNPPTNFSYSVYRSAGACPGGGFTEIASGLQLATYTDNTATRDTLWSYYVTVVDEDTSCESTTIECIEAPSFGLTASAAIEVCAPADGMIAVDLAAVGAFGDAVDLAASGNPAGTSASFDTDPVTPPGSSTLTVSGTGGAAAGTSMVTVEGTASFFSRSATTAMTIFDAVPGTPGLTTPADGALNQPTLPTFVWQAAAGVSGYTLEIATDPAFSNVVETIMTTETQAAPSTDLDTSIHYYWRVTGANACGDSPSAIFDFFTEAAPGDCGFEQQPMMFFDDDLEGDTSGWTSSGTGDTWGPSGARTHSGANAFNAEDVAAVSDQYLVSPALVLPTGSAPLTLQFWNHQTIEDSGSGCFDGAVVEISIDDGATWTRLESELLTDPYDGPVSTGFSNPIGGENAWCGDPQDWLESIVDLDAFAGETVRFRFRLATDSSVGREGWYIDDVVVQGCENAGLFNDGFESGDTSAWSASLP